MVRQTGVRSDTYLEACSSLASRSICSAREQNLDGVAMELRRSEILCRTTWCAALELFGKPLETSRMSAIPLEKSVRSVRSSVDGVAGTATESNEVKGSGSRTSCNFEILTQRLTLYSILY